MDSSTSEGNEVGDFLLRIRQLGEKTDREDELRAKQLEQEILEGRKRRQALRAERARSLSPSKVDADSDKLSENISSLDISERKITPKSKEQDIRDRIESVHGPTATISLFPSATKHVEAPKIPAWKEALLKREQDKRKEEEETKTVSEIKEDKQMAKNRLDSENFREKEREKESNRREESLRLEKERKESENRRRLESEQRENEGKKRLEEQNRRILQQNTIRHEETKKQEFSEQNKQDEVLQEQQLKLQLEKELRGNEESERYLKLQFEQERKKREEQEKQEREERGRKEVQEQAKALPLPLRNSPNVVRVLPVLPPTNSDTEQASPGTPNSNTPLPKLSAVDSSARTSVERIPSYLERGRTPVLTPSQSSPGPFLQTRSPSPTVSLSRSPTRGAGGFVQSALLKREGTLRSSGGSPSPQFNRTPTQMRTGYVPTTTPPGLQSTRSQIIQPLPLKKSPPVVPPKKAETPDITDAFVASPIPVPHSTSDDADDIGPPFPPRPSLLKSDSDVGPPYPPRPLPIPKASVSLKKVDNKEDDTEDNVSLMTSAIHPLAADRRGRSNITNTSPQNSSRRLSPVRQTSWLESALKKNSPGPSAPDTLLGRSSTFRSPSPSKEFNHNPSSPFLGSSPSVSLPIPGQQYGQQNRPVTDSSWQSSKTTLVSTSTIAKNDFEKPTQIERPLSLVGSSTVSTNTLSPLRSSKPILTPDSLGSSPSTTISESPQLGRTNTFATLKPSSRVQVPPPLAPKPAPEAVERLRSLRPPSPNRPKEELSVEALDRLRNLRSPSPPPAKAQPTSEAVEKLRALKKRTPPPAPEKSTIEAVEQLRRLRSSSPTKQPVKDEAKDTIEQAKASLRRSNTVHTQSRKPSEESGDDSIAAKKVLSRSTGSRNIPLSSVIESTPPPPPPSRKTPVPKDVALSLSFSKDSTSISPPVASPNNFRDDLASALMRGPADPTLGVKKASTLDNSELGVNNSESDKSDKQLSHMTKKRARGPKRRLPTNVSKGSTPRRDPSPPSIRAHSELNIPKQRSLSPLISSGGLPVANLPPPVGKSSRTVSSTIKTGGPPKPRKPSSSIQT